MKLRSTLAALFGSLMLADGAFALSCAQPDLIETLEQAKASDKLYHVLVGKFTPKPKVAFDREAPLHFGTPRSDEAPLVKIPRTNKSPKIKQFWFEGISLANDPHSDGQLTRFPVDIQLTCSSMWCSSPPNPDQDVIAFVQARESQAPLLNVSPCPKWIFKGNTPDYISDLRGCLDKDCTGLQLGAPESYTHPGPR